jgi:ketosteroid isomerase-like protein
VFSAAWYDARRGRVARWSSTAAITFGLLAFVSPGWSQGARIPADAVDAFHAALKKKDTAAALSLLDRGLVVFEFGVVDPTVEAYAFRHLPFDIDVAAVSTWSIESRRVGGEGNERWVLTTYHVTGRQADGSPIDQITLETMILRRTSDLFRIVHMHWSTNDPKFQALSQPSARPKDAPPPK